MADYNGSGLHIFMTGYRRAYSEMRLGIKIADASDEIMEKWASDVATATGGRVWAHRHPSGLFKGLVSAPSYRVQRKSPFYYKVVSPFKAWNEPASRVEFMHFSKNKSGQALIRGLTKEYGREKGRAMYATFDATEAAYTAQYERAIDKIIKDTNKATE